MSSPAVRNVPAVTPAAYLALAEEWAQSGETATLRSAVDRAYYAAFLSARDQLSGKGYGRFAPTPQAHIQVARALAAVQPELDKHLRALRRARNRLTYQTNATDLPDGLSLQELLNLARAVMAAVEALPAV